MPRWRAKHFRVRVSPTRMIIITVRRFHVPPVRRSKTFRQIIIPVYVSSVKEIAVRLHRKKPFGWRSQFTVFLRPAKLIPILMLVLGLGGILYFGVQVGKDHQLEPAKAFSLPAPSTTQSAKASGTPKTKTLPRSEPTHINVPSVQIDYDIMSVGRLPDGTMETPPLFDKITGWYKYSPTPGEIGPAIIVGHIDTYKGPSVFWRLREIQPGAIVEITRADGSIAKFKVEALKQFDQNNFPTQEVYGNIDHAGLRLITCGGTFDRQTGHYNQNTVVFASLI